MAALALGCLGALRVFADRPRQAPAPEKPPRSAQVRERLAGAVAEFDNRRAPLVQTLLRVAAEYDLPMGIERVVPEALDRPMGVQMRGGTVAGLLEACLHQVAGYAWEVQDGVVVVFGQKERGQSSNLFNLVIPSFEADGESADALSDRLRTTVVTLTQKPAGIVGSYLGNAELEKRPLKFTVRSGTLRGVLNKIVALDGEAVWVARVGPERLSTMPQGGLWVLLPRSVRDPRGLLDIEPPAPH